MPEQLWHPKALPRCPPRWSHFSAGPVVSSICGSMLGVMAESGRRGAMAFERPDFSLGTLGGTQVGSRLATGADRVASTEFVERQRWAQSPFFWLYALPPVAIAVASATALQRNPNPQWWVFLAFSLLVMGLLALLGFKVKLVTQSDETRFRVRTLAVEHDIRWSTVQRIEVVPASLDQFGGLVSGPLFLVLFPNALALAPFQGVVQIEAGGDVLKVAVRNVEGFLKTVPPGLLVQTSRLESQ